MADLKFSCPQCGQHIGYSEEWAGHQIECPACHSGIIVPQVQRAAAAPAAPVRAKEPAPPPGARLAAGVTQVARSTAHAAAPTKKFIPKRHGSDNALLKYGTMVIVLAVLAGAGYFYGLPLLNNALQQTPGVNAAPGSKASQSGGGMGGPMGEVSGAMDASEALDAGSAATRPRAASPTNNAARARQPGQQPR